MSNEPRFGLLLLLLALLAVSTVAFAEEGADEDVDVGPYLSKRYFATVGLFFPERELKFRLDSSVSTVDSTIDFSERFKLSSNDETGSFEIGWRFRERWLLRGQYFSVDNSNSATLSEDTQWGDYTFNAGTGVRAGTDATITRLFVGRRYRQSDASELGFGAGLHLLELGAFIQGNAIIDGVDAGFRDASASVRGPMPNLGGWYIRSLSPRWAFNVRADWLAASVGKYDGRIINAAVGLNYALTDHFGVGANYNFFELNVGVDDSSWKGRAISRFDGLYIFVSGYW